MNPAYLDLHIDTSKDPNNRNQNYDLDTLIEKVSQKADGIEFLISFTDHNTINEKVYLEALEKIGNKLILGVQLHIQTHIGQDSKAYQCHIYFDGFTYHSDKKTKKAKKHLKRLGINEFINLLNCSYNYDPSVCPNTKGEETYKFFPAWMYATPTFGGLRLSLSDNSRFVHSQEKPREWRGSIRKIKINNNENINTNIKLTSGLNVIIGESSSGKTLLLDSLCRRQTGKEFDYYNNNFHLRTSLC